MKQKIIRKTKINWILTESTIIAFDSIQATIYYSFDVINKQFQFDEMRRIIRRSKPDELNSWVDVLVLAQEKGIRGYGTRLKQEWFEES